MLSLRKTVAAAGVALVEVAPPSAPGPGEAIIDIAAAGICGSDLHIDKWDASYAFMTSALPVTLGHEFAGRVIETGADVDRSLIGQAVTVMPAAACGACAACQLGQPTNCTDRRILGLSLDGGFAPRVKVRAAQCLRLPDQVGARLGALTEPLTISLHAVKDGDVKPGDRVLIFGPGTIGQGAALFAERAGAREVVVVGINDASRFETLRALGFDRLIDLAAATPSALRDAAGPGGFDSVIEASGSQQAFLDGLALLRPEGVLSAVGIHARPVTFDLNSVVRRRLVIRGSARASRDIWTEALNALSDNPARYSRMITHDLSLQDAMAGFALGHERAASKVLLHPGRL